jgi:hypothetical protein
VLHERGAGSRIRLGLLSALWHATPRVKLQTFKFTASICRNIARNSMAKTGGFSVLDRGVIELPQWTQRRTLVRSQPQARLHQEPDLDRARSIDPVSINLYYGELQLYTGLPGQMHKISRLRSSNPC